MHKPQETEQGTKPSNERSKRSAWENLPWELVKPIDFDGEDTSLSQEHLAILR